MRRPLGITILALLALMLAVGQLFSAMTLRWAIEHGIPGEAWWISAMARSSLVLLGLLYGIVGIGLWKLQKWARFAFILWSAILIWGDAVAVVFVLQPPGSLSTLRFLLLMEAVFVACLSYMFTRKVRQAFSGEHRSPQMQMLNVQQEFKRSHQ